MGVKPSRLWRLPASAILAKLYVQRLSVAGDFDLRDTGLAERPQRTVKLAVVDCRADRAANVGGEAEPMRMYTVSPS